MGETGDFSERAPIYVGREIAGPHSPAPSTTPEVEFALVINRMIDSVMMDPEHLRATVYELARHKLKEQFADDPDLEKLSDALEVAIRGVENFTIRKRQEALPGPGEITQLTPPISNPEASPTRKDETRWSNVPVRFVVVLAMALSILFVVKQKDRAIDMSQRAASRLVALLGGQAPKQTLTELPQGNAPVATAPPIKPPLTPTAYGVYAISGDKLYELELLPGRAPDRRVAISAAILTPSRTTLPDGHLKFIVFRRDSATAAADHAEVRIVAKIARETSFDQAGKPIASKPDDSWVIRNISVPYRTSPRKDEPDMYEVQSEDPETALAPGRYVLVLKAQAYDFSVGGAITDPKQCLERLAATNGQFYSECPIGQPPSTKG